MQPVQFHFTVPGDDFTQAGEASSAVKRSLRQLGIPSETIRRVAIALYEGEINLVIHAGGGEIAVQVTPDQVEMVLADQGPGIADVQQAMQPGWSTATDQVRELGFGAGMGLPNMKQYSDAMEIESTVGVGTTVTMRVNVSK